MNIAFMHYHLKTGGVTTVIGHQLSAIRNDCDTLVLTGEPSPENFGVDVRHYPELGYTETIAAPETIEPQKVADRLAQDMHSKWSTGGCDLLHVHNPTLAKNRWFLQILKALQRRGIRLLLQIHDFAEDGRPGAYFSEDYPRDCHYAVLNARDRAILLAAGLRPEGVHQIPNVVRPLPSRPDAAKAETRRVLYPVRAIRRKNIGEALLLSLFFDSGQTLTVTLPPNSPADMPAYTSWKHFCTAKGLPVQFEAGLRYDLADLVHASDYLLTTSITEGFGFSFLEPWTAYKLLGGRKLPDICSDFESNGLRLEHLYTHLVVPLDRGDKEAFRRKWVAAVHRAGRRFGHPIGEKAIECGFGAATAGNCIDFGLLDETQQQQIIARVLAEPHMRRRLYDLNPILEHPVEMAGKQKLVEHNRRVVLAHYNPDGYRDLLLAVYRKVLKRGVRQQIDKASLFAHFLDLERFSLLKWSPYGG
jgi:hypothetical protein